MLSKKGKPTALIGARAASSVGPTGAFEGPAIRLVIAIVTAVPALPIIMPMLDDLGRFNENVLTIESENDADDVIEGGEDEEQPARSRGGRSRRRRR